MTIDDARGIAPLVAVDETRSAQLTVAEIGARVRELRLQRGVSQLELATKLKMDPANLHRIESGRQNVTFETMQRIYRELGRKPGLVDFPLDDDGD